MYLYIEPHRYSQQRFKDAFKVGNNGINDNVAESVQTLP